MGIPSFYRHLVKLNPTLIKKQSDLKSAAVLALDFNCAIYHCLSILQKKTPYKASNRIEFEDELIRSAIKYIVKLRDHVQPTDLLYVAIDGVVPMAKIRQQRMRRFKSVWVAREEGAIKAAGVGAGVGAGIEAGASESWDRNAITPGTAFMERLCARIEAWAKGIVGGPKIIISGVNESGEGEQKIMSYLRAVPPRGEVVVYGLDADLIVLCLWHHQRYGWSFKLLREEVEMRGGVKLTAAGEEILLYFDINQLAEIIKAKWPVALEDYVGAMSFLGNDFVPHGLTLCIREDGIDRLMEILISTGRRLVVLGSAGSWSYDPETMRCVIAGIAARENRWVSEGVFKKLKMSAHGRPNKDAVESDVEKALNIMNSLPLSWKVERCMATRSEDGWVLNADWTDVYYKEFLWAAEKGDAVKEWLHGIQWILNYYTGGPVDMLWYYPWYLPPLFQDIDNTCLAAAHGRHVSGGPNPISPIAQLIMVLPVESYALLPQGLRRMPLLKPEFYPQKWGFFSAGRRQLWECEPMIPMLPFQFVKRLLR